MTEPSTPPAAGLRRWAFWTAILAVATGLAIAIYLTTLFIEGDQAPWQAARLLQLTWLGLGLATLGVAGRWIGEGVMVHVDRRLDEHLAQVRACVAEGFAAHERHVNRRHEQMVVSMHNAGMPLADLEANTGEIPRIIVAHPATNGRGVDPAVVEAANRLTARVLPFDR